jgi:periplasmic divalent cation tolerance protein
VKESEVEMVGKSDAIVVLVTTNSRAEAERLADMLVDSRLAACVQIMPEMQSIYRWNESVQHETEILLIIKTMSDQFAALEREVRELHSYDTPEIIALPVTAISAPYLEWLSENVGQSSLQRRHSAAQSAQTSEPHLSSK